MALQLSLKKKIKEKKRAFSVTTTFAQESLF